MARACPGNIYTALWCPLFKSDNTLLAKYLYYFKYDKFIALSQAKIDAGVSITEINPC